ncbi:hypothetical protein ACIBF7_15070 [Nonomuraea sp. NPDC050478]|uniref:hypothetical protein n=1 Tax=Nonomuraea sp. NPDC050478 TaxID=3364365 RepID=UPI0037B261BE
MNPGVETTAPGAGGGGRLDHGWRIVAALAVTQTIGYGVLYYAFSVFLMPMSRDLRATGTQIAAALTLAVLTTALCAPRAGRWLDALVVRRSRMPAAKPGRRADLVREAVRARPFWFLVAAFTAHGGGVAVIGVLLVTYLIHLGHAPVFAATVAGLLGVLSVTGRVVTTGLRRRWAAAPVAAAVFAVQGLGALLLPVVAGERGGGDRVRAAVRDRVRRRYDHAPVPAGRAVRHRRLRQPVGADRDVLRHSPWSPTIAYD